MEEKKNKIALIDVQNTESTTKQLLGFLVDWRKLYEFLKNDWKCEKVILYSGVDEGDLEKAEEFENLEKLGCAIRTKTEYKITFSHFQSFFKNSYNFLQS